MKPLLAQNSRKLIDSVTHYWTKAESTQWRIQETGQRARVELQNCTDRNGAGECLVVERRAFPTAGSTVAMTGVSQPIECIPSRTSHPSDLHKKTATQTPPSTLLLHSVVAHGLLNKEHGNSQITQWIIAENTRCDKPHTSNWSLGSACHKTFVFLAYWKGHHPPLLQFASCLNQKQHHLNTWLMKRESGGKKIFLGKWH